ncbi:MAG: nucleotidyl transferase AbiEii/AbiGii toxin family protein [Kiritimatiellae bacterium]|nr:nucleotidyl transferase AbiEii/AbiGii toxin family protein [Kiritimatiellia bacterium]
MNPESMRFKAQLRNVAARTGVPAQLLLQDFFLERFLDRLCATDVRARFVFKGGILLMGLLGIARRTTMDLDATLRGLPLSPDTVETLVRSICAIDCGDGVTFAFSSLAPIRKDDQYGGFRVKLSCRFLTLSGQISLDVSTGDAIAGGPVEHALASQFDPARAYRVWGYPVEVLLAEKVEAIFALGELGTRPRDYYDVLMVAENLPFSPQRFAEAFRATVAHRGSRDRLGDLLSRLEELARSPALLDEWARYRRRYPYAADIPFDRPIAALRTLLSALA